MIKAYRLEGPSDPSQYQSELHSWSMKWANNLVDQADSALKKKAAEIALQGDTIDYRLLQQAVVPIVKEAEVFISFSHRDEKYAIDVARYLSQYFKVFIDPLFWGSVDEALKIFDENNCLLEGETTIYDYDKRNISTSIFHVMLADSIQKTIKKCRYFIFIATKNSLTSSDKTLSPWLYLENSYCQEYLETFVAHSLTEGAKFEQNVEFPLNFTNFETITEEVLVNIVRSKDMKTAFGR